MNQDQLKQANELNQSIIVLKDHYEEIQSACKKDGASLCIKSYTGSIYQLRIRFILMGYPELIIVYLDSVEKEIINLQKQLDEL